MRLAKPIRTSSKYMVLEPLETILDGSLICMYTSKMCILFSCQIFLCGYYIASAYATVNKMFFIDLTLINELYIIRYT
jgi:hypothetical protein